MAFDIIEKELKRPTIFKNEGALLPDYVPMNLIHREEQLKALSRIFRLMIDSPGMASQKAILIGDVGVGKTVVAKRFGFTLEFLAKERKINLKYIHINCYKDRTLFLIMKKIIQTIMPGFPDRGFSAQELFHVIWKYLEEEDGYLLLTLDEMDFLTRIEGEAPIYFLSRLGDEYLKRKQRLSLILIARRFEALGDLDERTKSTLLHNIIKFERYNSNQLYDIIKMRSNEALKDGVVNEEVLRMIAEIAAPRGDARYALELLWRAGKYADAEGLNKILPEHVRKAQADVFQIPANIILELPLHERLFLLSIAILLKKSKSIYVTMGEVENTYRVICEERKLEPRKHTQLWEYLQDLKNLGVLQTKVVNIKGRTTLIGLMDISADALESLLR